VKFLPVSTPLARCGSALRQRQVGTNSKLSIFSQRLLIALVALVLLSPRSFGQDSSKKAEVSPLEAVLQSHLPHRDGVVSLYYSACCSERAFEIQKSVQDMIAFYREKLGVGDPLALAVLDANDWDRVMQRTTAFRFPYGLTTVYPVAPSGYILFIPADDKGVITQHLRDIRRYASADTLKLFTSAHLTYDEAVHRVILQTSYHETGHTLVYEYGIGKMNYFLNEILANYLAYAYAKARDPQTATVAEGFVKMAMPPGAYTSLEDFEAHREDIFKTNPSNYDWYQLQFGLRANEIYDEQGLGFLAKVKSAFPKGTAEMSVADTLSRLEAISPGFEAWARRLSQYKSESVPTQ
jgi:hypothetical protein